MSQKEFLEQVVNQISRLENICFFRGMGPEAEKSVISLQLITILRRKKSAC